MAEVVPETVLKNEETKKKNVDFSESSNHSLEEKSKEELIKIVAKQLNLLKRAKGKSDDLGRRCQVLEEEKQAAFEKQSATIVNLQLHIDKLEKDYSDLSEKKNKVVEEKNNELDELRSLLRVLESEKTSVTSLLNERDEQIQCLTMQLSTVKETCQFLQAELIKFQTENQECKAEIIVLTEARNSTVESLKYLTLNSESKSREYENLVKEMTELKCKFEACKKENDSSAFKIENLTGQIKALQLENSDFALKLKNNESSIKSDPPIPGSDFMFLMSDNQKLVSENNELKGKLLELENGPSCVDADLNDRFLKVQKEYEELQKENKELIQNVCKLGSHNTALQNAKKVLEDNNHELNEELEQMKSVKLKLQDEVSVCLREKENLNNEIKRLSSALVEHEEYKYGFEHALLHGAESGHLDQSLFEPRFEYKQEPPNNSETLPESNQPIKVIHPPIANDPEMMMGGLEFGLLSGGTITEACESFMLEGASAESVNVTGMELEKTLAENAELMEKVDKLTKQCTEYGSLLQETLSEKESLKLKLETVESEKNALLERSQKDFIDAGSNTANLAKEDHLCDSLESDLDVENEKLKKEVARLLTENSEYQEQFSKFISEIDGLKSKSGELDVLEKHNLELNEKLEMKTSELEELNFQLELLVISIKQGVRQKNSGAQKKSEKPLQENLALIKNLLDDLIIKCNNSAIRQKSLESNLEELMAQKEAAEYEIQQIKELNQFLEDEASELRLELEQLKSNQELSEEKYSNIMYERSIKGTSELYSIDEMDEKTGQEDRPEQPDNETQLTSVNPEENSEIYSTDFSVQVNIQSEDSYKNKLDSLVNEENELTDSCQKSEFETTIKNLNSEISDLKGCLEDKTNLVEKIHWQLDSQLEQIEALNLEMKEKEDDLRNSRILISSLQQQLLQHESNSISLKESFKKAKSIILELNAEKNQLNSSISTFKALSEEEMKSIKDNLPSVVNEFIKSVNLDCDKCTHLVKVNTYVKNYLCSASSGIEKMLKSLIIENNADCAISDFLRLLESNTRDENLNHGSLDGKCSNDCCALSVDIDNLRNLNHKFFSLLYNFLKNTFENSAAELNEYKVNTIPSLKSTITDLENQLHEYLNKNSSMSDNISEQKLETSSSEAADEDLKSQLADKEVKMNKFKQIALKMKKELMECKKKNSEISLEKEKYLSQLKETQKEMENLSTEQLQYVQNYQSLQNEYDNIQDELELQKENAKKSEGDFSSTLHELNLLKEKVSELEAQLLKSKQMLDTATLAKQEKKQLNVDLESKLIVAESKIQEKAMKVQELEATIKDKIDSMSAVTEENNNLKRQLEISLKEEKKKNLMDLEMADYERSVEELNNTIQKKDDEINELKLKLTCEIEKNEGLLEEIKSTETLKETEEKRVVNLKEVFEKTKSELSSVKEREEELATTVSSLKMQLEILVQQEENCKLQLSETSSEMQHLKEMLKTSSENHQRIVRSFESKIATQKQEILLSHKEVENTKQEFENYKTRVHSVLKQQKSTTPAFATVEEDLTEKLESVIEKLKLQVKDLNEKLTAVSLEYEGLQEEHDVLLQRYNKALSDREKEENEWHLRLQQLNTEKSKLRTAQEELSSQHLLQNEMLVSTYKKQIKILSEEHKRTVNDLQKQLESSDLEITRLQRDQQKTHGLPVTPTMQEPMSFDILSQERQEGEGSESIDGSDTPVRHYSLSTIPSSGFVPLEKLLQSPLEGNTPRNSIQYQDCEKLVSDLNASNKQIEHLSEVLNESESASLRLSEQVRVLKEEVRRLERNKEREEHAENLEYLKNVFIKFSTLNACTEKAMLIPVLTTMLKLSPSEQQQLKSIAGDMDPNDAANSGWGSYLHRWSGLA